MIVQIASALLVGAALLDGISTVRMLRRGNVEQNPLFGSSPSVVRVFGEGAAIIVGEVTIALLLKSSLLGLLAAVGLLIQSGFHVGFAVKNFRL